MFKHGAEMRVTGNLIATVATALIFLCACNRLATPPSKQMVKDADALASNGDFLQAINLYEGALDGSPHSADIHYKLALLYDDKMGDPLNALHHFKRYLTLAPNGARTEEVKGFMKRDELALLTTLSGDSVVSRAEAARLKNENLELRKQLEERQNAARNAAANEKTARAKSGTRARKRAKQNSQQR